MAAATRASVRNMLAAQTHRADPDDAENPLEDFWEPLITQARAEAEAWLRNELSGFGDAAVAKWGMFEHYHRRLALFFCGLYGTAQLTDGQRNLLRLMDCREEVKALESLGPDDADDASDDVVSGGLMSRTDDLFRRPSVNSGGSIPGDIFNTPAAWTYSR